MSSSVRQVVARICVVVVVSLPGLPSAATVRELAGRVLRELGVPDTPPGEVLLREDFSSGSLGRWSADAGWEVVADPGAGGKCARVVSSDDHEDLVLNQHIPVVPGHPIALCYRTRFVSGTAALFVRVDYFDANGKSGKPYAKQVQGRQGREWTQNAIMVSDWFPDYTRAITVHFHHEPNANTVSLLSDVRVVDLAPLVAEGIRAEADEYAEAVRALASEAATLPDTPAARWWRPVIARHSARLLDGLADALKLDPGSPAMHEAVQKPGSAARRLTHIVEGLRTGRVTTTGLAAFGTKPITSTMVLPHSVQLPEPTAGRLSLTACPGENESASMVLWAPDGLKGVLPQITGLKATGTEVPGVVVDLKWVKCWYQAGSAPHGIGQDRSKKVLVPELLLNDDSLVRVDFASRRNELKLAFPDGARYVDINDPAPPDPGWGFAYTLSEFPVRDSLRLLPADLPAGENRQVWITVSVPATAEPGEYVGKVTFAAGREKLGDVELSLRVLPFTLPEPRTRYDLSREYTGSLYYWGELEAAGRGTIGYKLKSEQQFRAEMKTMVDHNIVAPAMIWSPRIVYEDEQLFRRHLAVARELGVSGRPLYTADSSLVGNPTDPDKLRALQGNVRKTLTLAREYGFPTVYFYAIDEATGGKLLSQKRAWEAVHEAGGRIIVSGYAGHLEAVGDVLDLLNRAGDPASEDVAEWHRRGGKVWNYANPQTPVEDPEVYRRNYGLYDWELDLDGVCTYCFMDSSGTQWNDFDCDAYRDHCLAYPTVDGVVATLAIAGLREGLDDVKYATFLRKSIAEAMDDGAPRARAAAARAEAWLEELDPRQVDLDVARETIIRFILELRE